MRKPGLKSGILAAAILLDLIFVFFPDWEAVNPTNPDLTVPLGNSWILTPPQPPSPLTGLRVEKGSGWIWGIALTSGAALLVVFVAS